VSSQVKCIIANSLENFIQSIFPSGTNENKKQIYWFRGHENFNWTLQPTLYREIIATNIQENKIFNERKFWKQLLNTEKIITDEFTVKNYHLMESDPPENPYLLYSLMQHNGISTRLLDWTEQAIAALFFSLAPYFNSEKKYEKKSVPCVWVLKPLRFQQWAINEFNSIYKARIAQGSDYINSALNIYQNRKLDKLNTIIPSPIITSYNNERIRAQSGVFTIFPDAGEWCKKKHICPTKLNLENLLSSEDMLFKIILAAPEKISDQLKQIGCKRSNYFPEIPIVSSEIEEKYIKSIQK
jgi:hypothetical protein